MAKGRPRKNKKDNDKNQLAEMKRKFLQKLHDMHLAERTEYEAHLNNLCKETCNKIDKLYDDKLKALPENIRNMTLSEYMEAKRKDELEESKENDMNMLAEIRETKLMSERKKTLKKTKTERKRSFSSCSSVCSGKTTKPSMSRVLSESCLTTPFSKRSTTSQFVITPKFNPKMPISKICMRKPRAGEVVLSVSGSPLLNFADDVAISLGAGNIINMADETEASKLDSEFLKKLDESTKSTLESVKKKLDLMLKA